MSVVSIQPVPSPPSPRPSIVLRDQLWPIADQCVLSGTNLAGTVLLARAVSTSEFGAFALAFAGLMLAGSVQAALITHPHNVLGAMSQGEAYRRYTTTTAIGQLLLCALGSLIVIASWVAVRATDWPDASLLPPLAGAVFAWQAQEFLRRVLYTEGRVRSALVNDSLTYGTQLSLLCLLHWVSALSAVRALHIITASSLLGAGVGWWQLRKSFSSKAEWKAARHNWDYGKWLLGASIAADWLATQLFLFVAALALGRAFAGILRAFQAVFGPARIVVQAVAATLPTRLIRASTGGGEEAWHREWRGTLILAIPLLTAYCVTMTLVAVPVLRLVFGPEYASHAGALGLYGLASWLGYLTVFGAAALRSRNRTRIVFICEALSLIAIPLTLPLIPWLGLIGVIISMIATDLSLVVLLWFARPWRADP
jgi:O-antigen/teichoic acid export membrane protein